MESDFTTWARRRRGALAGFLISALAAGAAWADGVTRVAALAGTVELQKEAEGAWEPATVGIEVPEGGSVRTSGDGRAELHYPDGTRVWLKESTKVTIETQRSLLSRMSIAFGSMKARVSHLARNRRMEFKTATAVAAVRGTVLTISQGEDGKFNLNVLFGKVELRLAGIPKTFDVPQGQKAEVEDATKAPKTSLMTRAEEVQGLQDWAPGLAPEGRIKDLQDKERDRAQIHEFAKQEEGRRERMSDLIGRAKEEDLAAGRTLLDMHGNLVRVDQRLLRPTPNEIQFVNLVKRPTYNYKTRTNSWEYYGPTTVTNRLDSAQFRLNYDAALPEELSAWPQFFGDHEPNSTELIFANMSSFNESNPALREVFEVAMVSKRVIVDGVSKLVPDLYVGRIECAVGNESACLSGMRNFTNLTTDSSGAAGFSKFGQTEDANSVIRKRDAEDGIMREIFAEHWGNAGDTSHVFLAQENAVIDNNGNPRRVEDFTNTSSDPFSILRETAYQTIMQVKKVGGVEDLDLTNTGDHAKFCSGGTCNGSNARNIDLVVTPDVGLAFLQRIISDIDKLETSSSN